MAAMPPGMVDVVSRPVYIPGTSVPTGGNHDYTIISDPTTGRAAIVEFLPDPATGLLTGYLYNASGNPQLAGVVSENQYSPTSSAGVVNPYDIAYDSIITVAAQGVAYFNATSAINYPALGVAGQNSNSADFGFNDYLSSALGLNFSGAGALSGWQPQAGNVIPASSFTPNWDNLFEYASYVATGVDPHIQAGVMPTDTVEIDPNASASTGVGVQAAGSAGVQANGKVVYVAFGAGSQWDPGSDNGPKQS